MPTQSALVLPPIPMVDASSPAVLRRSPRKRKAESQDSSNDRLSKRLGLLNLEPYGSKLYVPVENPAAETPQTGASSSTTLKRSQLSDSMQVDDSKYKVYIHNLDDELSSSDSEPEDGRLIFLPDIEKHLKATRIPPMITANDDGELAGMQLVLYSEPRSLTVPEGQDSVRKAIIDARARLRQKQKNELRQEPAGARPAAAVDAPPAGSYPDDPDAMDLD